jgi:hypothetical protein
VFVAIDSSTEALTPSSPIPAGLLQRIRAEYLEMPGLKLTAAQARRLWGLDAATSDAALRVLVERAILSRTRKGLFVLAAGAIRR